MTENQDMTYTSRTQSPDGVHQSEFTWAIYGDATLAGLSALLPIPILDDVIEQRFRRRMPTS
jgi:hypothetical protein